MNAVVETVAKVPLRRLHLPKKILGDNFYPYMYGMYRCQRIQVMTRARHKQGLERSACVKEARQLNHEALWYLCRIERQP